MKDDTYQKDYERLKKYKESGLSCEELKEGNFFLKNFKNSLRGEEDETESCIYMCS